MVKNGGVLLYYTSNCFERHPFNTLYLHLNKLYKPEKLFECFFIIEFQTEKTQYTHSFESVHYGHHNVSFVVSFEIKKVDRANSPKIDTWQP